MTNTLARIMLLGFLAALTACQPGAPEEVSIKSGALELKFNSRMHSMARLLAEEAKPLMEGFQPSEALVLASGPVQDFELKEVTESGLEDERGAGRLYRLSGQSAGQPLTKTVEVSTYADFPGLAVFKVIYTNTGDAPIEVQGWRNHAYQLAAQGDDPPFWSFQGASYDDRRDWIQPIRPGFSQENYMGMNASDYGGGTPVVSLWRPDCGLAVGHVEMMPRLVSLPVNMPEGSQPANVRIDYRKEQQLAPGASLSTYKTFVLAHTGDYYPALREYSRFMQASGLEFAPVEEAAFEPVWCAWGYEREFTTDEIIGTLPKVKELGIKWAVLDDGYQIAEGDWQPNPKKFPRGEADMKALVAAIHDAGLKAQIWWAPLAVDPGAKLLEQDPAIILLNEQSKPQDITWWDSYYMSPAYEGARAHTREVVQMFLRDWDFDGLKMDGQHLNAVPPDYNPVHKLEYPEQSVEQLPGFFKMVYETAMSIKPDAVMELCPCGCNFSFYNMPYMNQSVSSDPLSSWQIRHKGKTFKALTGRAAYFGDHVELSDGGADFASSFGIGAVLGTKFTWPKDNPKAAASYLLTPEKEVVWKKWFGLYNDMKLSREPYLGELYDIGYDKPEAHAILKGEAMFYAFYAPEWDDKVELRGLQERRYRVRDYVNGKEYGIVQGPLASLAVQFEGYLLLEAVPE